MTKKTKLVVTQAFGAYAVGDQITDTDEIKAVKASNPASVVVTLDETPEGHDINAPEPVKPGAATKASGQIAGLTRSEGAGDSTAR